MTDAPLDPPRTDDPDVVSDEEIVTYILRRLVGLPLSAIQRTEWMWALQFGELRDTEEGPDGDQTLEFRCPWRLETEGAILTGRADVWDEADGDEWSEDYDYNLRNRCDTLLNPWFASLPPADAVVQEAVGLPYGRVRLTLTGGASFELYPDGTAKDEWRYAATGDTRWFGISGGEIREQWRPGGGWPRPLTAPTPLQGEVAEALRCLEGRVVQRIERDGARFIFHFVAEESGDVAVLCLDCVWSTRTKDDRPWFSQHQGWKAPKGVDSDLPFDSREGNRLQPLLDAWLAQDAPTRRVGEVHGRKHGSGAVTFTDGSILQWFVNERVPWVRENEQIEDWRLCLDTQHYRMAGQRLRRCEGSGLPLPPPGEQRPVMSSSLTGGPGEPIEETLARALTGLVGVPLIDFGFAGDMLMLSFGTVRVDSEGQYLGVNLHVSCPWRIETVRGLLTGRGDRWELAPDEIQNPDSDHGHLVLERLNALLVDGPDPLTGVPLIERGPLMVEGAEVGRYGDSRLLLSGGYTLSWFSDGSDCSESCLFGRKELGFLWFSPDSPESE